MAARPRSSISLASIPASIKKLQRRLHEVGKIEAPEGYDRSGISSRLANTVNATVDEVFGVGTADAADFHVDDRWFFTWSDNPHQQTAQFRLALDRIRGVLTDAINRLQEWAADAEDKASSRTLTAYQGLDLHPEIARAASDLYSDGHYANAIEDAVKALNAFVRLRSGVEDRDGTKLMEYVFSPNSPILAFNELKDDSDKDEQKGFMMMLSGAVAGLRNPRAHRLMKDDPERALEFIAFVSLLAKLVDEAKRPR